MARTSEVKQRVIDAWRPVEAPPKEAMRSLVAEFGEESAKEFVGVRPVDVDIRSFGFRNATPLLGLPPNAAGAYLGTYLISLFHELELQENSGVFSDLLTRAHTLTCLSRPPFWERVILGSLPPRCFEATLVAVKHLIAKKDYFRLQPEKIAFLEEMRRRSQSRDG